MSDQGPYSNAADGDSASPSNPEPGGTVSATAPAFETAAVAPPEPPTTPDLAPQAQASFTVPRETEQRGPTDKLWVHFVWEGLLLVLVALGIAAFFLFGPSGGLGGGERVAELLAGQTPFLLFAMALGLSMRVGSVNLAVVHLGLLSTSIFIAMDDQPLITAIGVVALVMVAAGVVLSLLVTVFKAPGWAAGLGVAMVAWFLISERELGIIPDGRLGARPVWEPLGLWLIVAAVVALSIVGGLIALARPLRETMGVCVEVTERRRGLSAGSFALTWASLIGSCLLAGAAGYLVLLPTGANLSIAVVNANGLAPLLTGLGIVLIGGTATRGRRGGVFGTLLAAVVVFMVAMLFQGTTDSWIINNAIPFGALLLGLLVNWLMDLINRPRTTVTTPYGQPVPVMAPAYAPTDPAPRPLAATEPAAQPVAPTEPATQHFAAAEPAAQPVAPTEAPAEPAVPHPATPAESPPAPAETAASHPSVTTAEPPPADTGDTTQEIPTGANPYLYRPPAG